MAGEGQNNVSLPSALSLSTIEESPDAGGQDISSSSKPSNAPSLQPARFTRPAAVSDVTTTQPSLPRASSSSSDTVTTRSTRPDSIAIPPVEDFQPFQSPLSPPISSTSTGSFRSDMTSGSMNGNHGNGTSTRLFPIRSVMHYHSASGKGKERSQPTTPGSPPPALHSHPSQNSTNRANIISSLDPFLPEPTTHSKNEYEPSGSAKNYPAEGAFTEDTSSRRTMNSGSVTSDKPLLMTARFEHSVAADGSNYVLTGREGVMEKCEDEPIHAPGAVQAFGVLIAFEEQPDGRLEVKQISENSRFILGLRPNDFFKAGSLTDLLEPEEVEALMDAIETLDERDLDPSNTEAGPINLQLSGKGNPGTSHESDAHNRSRLEWTCHCALHRPDRTKRPKLAVLELELMEDKVNPLKTESTEPIAPEEKGGMATDAPFEPTEAELQESTVSLVKPLRSLTRMKRRRGARGNNSLDLDIVSLLGQINEQLSKADDLGTFLKITAGVFKELTEFDRVMVYQFDEAWNGRVVAEQVDWTRTKDLYRGLNFPASDIPAQARELYRINKVRVLYDRDQPTARLCCRDLAEVNSTLDMTHCHLRAMSPIHIKYLGNMGVRSSMSISVTAFGDLWGLVALHTYGRYGQRVSFPVRQLCSLLGHSISRNIERLSYAKRLHARKLINTAPTEANPSGYIIARSEDLLLLFDADFGVLSIGEEAKILGTISNSQELLAVLEYLRVKKFTTMQSSQDLRADYPDIDYPGPFETIAGLLAVPLSSEGRDFIVFFRRGQLQEVKWAGNPYANKTEGGDVGQRLEPRKSFKTWSEIVLGKCRAWTDEQMETAGVLCLVYGKFIAVWREKESALAANQLNNLLLANASHEVRTPLNAIINYLELALDGEVTGEVRENLTRSHAASRSLIHVINDLLDLTRTEKGQDLYLQDPFNLATTLTDALAVHKAEAKRRGLTLDVVENPTGTPSTLMGDRGKIRTIVGNIVANAVKHTKTGGVMVEWGELSDTDVEDAIDKKQDSIRIGLSITDTGVGIPESKLESIFREFEQVSTVGDEEQNSSVNSTAAVGLGLAVVARIIRNLGGQLRVESKEGEGSKFTVIIPFRLPSQGTMSPTSSLMDAESTSDSSRTVSVAGARNETATLSRTNSTGSGGSSGRSDINSLISAMSSSHMNPGSAMATFRGSRSLPPGGNVANAQTGSVASSVDSRGSRGSTVRSNRSNRSVGSHISQTGSNGSIEIEASNVALRAIKVPAPMSGATQDKQQGNGRALERRSSLQRSSSRSGALASSEGHRGEINSEPATTARRGSFTTRTLRAGPTSPRSTRGPQLVTSPSIIENDLSSASSPTASMSTGGIQMDANGMPMGSPKHVSEYRKSPPAQEEELVPSMRVLVVEDELVNRMILQKRLTKDGHEVVVVEHGGDAVRLLEDDRAFDIILMDLQMPILNGYEATRAIRDLERDDPTAHAHLRPASILNGRIPIFAVTASLPERERSTIVDAGMDAWCLKPVDLKRLRKLMRGAVDVAKRSEEIYAAGQWEKGGWLHDAPAKANNTDTNDVADWAATVQKET